MEPVRRTGLLLIAALTLSAASAQEHHHQPPTAGTSTSSGSGLYTPDELMFLTHMIVHHEQALEMAALVPSRTHREEFMRFARYVDGAQRSEIDQMKMFLQLAVDRGEQIPQHEMHGDPPMAGMLSRAQMAALAAATGPQFERLWLQGMIYHHQGALDMARAQQEQEFRSGRSPFGLDAMLDDILNVQRGEIHKMQGWLKAWGLVEPRSP